MADTDYRPIIGAPLEQTKFHGFLPNICWPCHVSNVSTFGSGEETAEHSLLFCPKWAAKRQRYCDDSVDITHVFQDCDNLVEFLISSGHVPHLHLWALPDGLVMTVSAICPNSRSTNI